MFNCAELLFTVILYTSPGGQGIACNPHVERLLSRLQQVRGGHSCGPSAGLWWMTAEGIDGVLH